MQEVFDYITLLYQRRNRASSGIIYCRTRATCDALAAFLRGKGLNAKPYHRGIKSVTIYLVCREVKFADPYSSTDTLKQTLKNWSAGGHGEPGGVDLVSLLQTGP